MSGKGEKIMETFEKMLPKMNEQELDRLVSFTEGMAFMKDRQEKKTPRKNKVKF